VAFWTSSNASTPSMPMPMPMPMLNAPRSRASHVGLGGREAIGELDEFEAVYERHGLAVQRYQGTSIRAARMSGEVCAPQHRT
jgi:hypothetical protein